MARRRRGPCNPNLLEYDPPALMLGPVLRAHAGAAYPAVRKALGRRHRVIVSPDFDVRETPDLPDVAPGKLLGRNETACFRRLAYARWRTIAALKRLALEPSGEFVAEVGRWELDGDATADLIARANIGIVRNVVKRTGPDHEAEERLSAGLVAVAASLVLFDWTRGIRFSTYVYRAVQTAAYRTHRGNGERVMDLSEDGYANIGTNGVGPEEDESGLLAAAVLGQMSAKTRDIVERRFGLCGRRRQTLSAIGAEYGITKERVRQIVVRALGKAREAFQDAG